MSDLVDPRIGNTGVQNTSVESLRACVDWVEATFFVENFEIVFETLNLPRDNWIQFDRGALGYKKQMRCGKIVLLYDGMENMGIHMIMSGQACRQFEDKYQYTWAHFFNVIFKQGNGHFTRIDAAVDDFKGYFTIRQLRGKIRRGEASSKFKTARGIEKVKIADGSEAGETLYLGSDKSAVQVRFYDKLKERQGAGVEIEEGLTVWNRTEIQMRDKRADKFALILIRSYADNSNSAVNAEIGRIIAGVLKNYVNFLMPSNDSNKARWEKCSWWLEFLGEVEKVRLSQKAPDRTIEQTKKWFERQIPRTMAKIHLSQGGDLDYLLNVLQAGCDQLNERDIKQIDDYIERWVRKK